MIGVLQLTLVLDEAALFLACVTLVLRPRVTGWLFPGAVALQVLVLVQTAAGLVWLSGHHGLPRPGLLAAYLVASTLLLPVAGALVRRADVRLAAARLGAGSALAPCSRCGWPGSGPNVSGETRRAALTAAYSVLALAALSRAGYQLATAAAPPLAASLSGVAGAFYLVAAVGLRLRGPSARRLVLACCSLELAGVVVTSVVELAVGGFGRSVVWSGLGYGYGFLPLVLPALGISIVRRKDGTDSFPPVPLRS